jgi:hypothetical protein
MRSRIQLEIRDRYYDGISTTTESLVEGFLREVKFLPTRLRLDKTLLDEIMKIEEFHRDEKNLQSLFTYASGLYETTNLTLAQSTNTMTDVKNAIRVLASIPVEPNDERSNAVVNAVFSISCPVKRPSATVVPGVVSIRESRVEVRFRHQNARTLEEATTQFVRAAWKSMGPNGLFESFADGENVVIREPFSTENIYDGRICTPRSIRSRMRETIRDHVSEFVVFTLSVVMCAVLVVMSLSILKQIQILPDGGNARLSLLWKQGWLDRLATAFFTSGVYSAVTLGFDFFKAYGIPVIDWNSKAE